MSFMSATENISFNGIPQLSEATCASQYKMAVEDVGGVCGSELSHTYINDSANTDQTFLPHLNDNFFQSKFKIDPEELYTFHDSDIIASEVTVVNTEETHIEVVDFKPEEGKKNKKEKVKKVVANGTFKKPKLEVANGHCKPPPKPAAPKNNTITSKHNGNPQPKVQKKVQNQTAKDPKGHGQNKQKKTTKTTLGTVNPVTVSSIASPVTGSLATTNSGSSTPGDSQKQSSTVTFLDVFMREQGVVEEGQSVKVKLEPPDSPPPLAPLQATMTSEKEPTASSQKKPQTPSSSSGKPSSKCRRGRGPTHHEALQRISRRAVALPNRPWHAPGHELFDLRPLSDKPPNRFKRLLDGSGDEDCYLPSFDGRLSCVEEGAVENREQRISLRKAALRRKLALAAKALRHAHDFHGPKELANTLKKHMDQEPTRVPQNIVNELLMKRGMTSLLTAEDKKQLRAQGWSGGGRSTTAASSCEAPNCASRALPLLGRCARHAASAPAQRLFAPCAALFADGARCPEPLVPLADAAPLCAHHRAKRDNYDRLSREAKPKPAKAAPARKRPDEKPKRRRRPAPAAAPSEHTVVTVVNGASPAAAASPPAAPLQLGADTFIVSDDCDVQELEVEHVASDDILVDPSVLSQIPDEAFTEFFNQAEGGGAFEESSELTRALEAVLDGRALDALADCAPHAARAKLHIPTSSLSVEMSSTAPS